MSQLTDQRLRWMCRRGMKELDVLLERYLLRDWPSASATEQGALRQLLDMEDPDLYALCMGKVTAAPELVPVLEKIRAA